MPNLQMNRIGARLRVWGDTALAAHRFEICVYALQISAPLALNLIREQLWIHQRGVEPHLSTRRTVQRCREQQRLKVVGHGDE
jgi:hypothetical protein